MPQTMVTARKGNKSLVVQVMAILRRFRPMSVLKMILKALLAANSVPIIEWLIRGRKRKHLDAVSALQVNLLDRPYISGVMLFKVKTDRATIARELEKHFFGDANGPQYKKDVEGSSCHQSLVLAVLENRRRFPGVSAYPSSQ